MITVLLSAMLASADPSNLSAYNRGVAARRAGDHEAAIKLLEEAARSEANNADVWVQYGFALRDLGQADRARKAFERAIQLAPSYQDARDGLASVSQTTGLREASLSADASATHVQKARDWREIRISGAKALNEKATIRGVVEASERFAHKDVYGEVRFERRPSNKSSYYVLVGGTISADYRPRWQIGSGGEFRIAGTKLPLVATMDGSVAKYVDGTTWIISPGFQQYVGEGSIWLTGKWINVFSDGRHSSGGLGRIDVQASEDIRFFGGFAKAPDLSEGRVMRTASYFGGGTIAISKKVDWRVSIARDKPSNGLTRTTLSTGLSIRVQ